MKHLCQIALSLLPLSMLLLVGCNGCASGPGPVKPAKVETKKEANPFQSFLNTVRYSENPRVSDDWTRFRDGLPLLNSHFNDPDVMARMRLSSQERKFLAAELRLSEDELGEVEATAFRTADGHYLDECFLLRAAARSLEVNGLGPLQLAERHFRWVMRNVYLHEQGDSWTPPAFTLRRGHGSALERSLVLLALWRQLNFEGCLIVVPEAEPKQFLVAVLDAKASRLHLFDPRLGLAVRNEQGDIATLKEVQENPKLLESSAISADQVKKLEAWLVCPLYALSPRMLELQKGLSAFDAITLHLNADRLARSVAAAAGSLPVKAWNDPKEGGKLPNSPTRCLRMFLPKVDGGVNETGRTHFYMLNRLPFEQVRFNFAQVNVVPELIPKLAYDTLMTITQDMFSKFDVQTREMYLRGMHEPAIRRQIRLQAFAQDEALAGLERDKAFRTELAKWQKQLSEFQAVDPNDPRAFAMAQKAVQGLVFQDQFLGWLLDLNNEKKLERDQKKGVVTGILAVGVKDYFDFTLARERASVNHEKASRLQAQIEATKDAKKALRTKAAEAWAMARNAWSNFYIDKIAIEPTISQRLEQILHVPAEAVPTRIGLLEPLHREVHHYFEAKLRLAECIQHLDGDKAMRAYLERLLTEIEALEQKDFFKNAFKTTRSGIDRLQPQARAFWGSRLDLLSRDWSPSGSFNWMKQHIRVRLAKAA